MNICIESLGLTKRYGGRNVVDQLHFRVPKGSFYGFLGPNGAGKSTTIKMLTGTLAPDAGSARILGFDLQRSSLEIKRRIGVVPENLCLFENLSGPEYLRFIGRMYGLPGTVVDKRCDELLELLSLHTAARTLILEYSHGMRKKLALCAAVIHDPELLFLDEPFEGVDAVASRIMRDLLSRLRKRGVTVFLTSHILEVMEKLCTHIGILCEGHLAKQGTIEDFQEEGGLDHIFLQIAGAHTATSKNLSWLGNE
ncbi:MAG TPA: ABC transporter ATP-binding protein [Candidatus Hydrogenedentes bacterium]|nr:ABC transporter ATP-binding protein [Candidatus Hydrogenedentota bacterium]HOR51394.1 ABC transporter ATP-binding protein [Candidatus Hydrogenedentota bacterium]HPK24662.1 ABC transporter ATP-binding protein [Candidatus Hydrogenedentota bacterium]HPX85604.1 ABC transporter ATP-binding protein [Candidatus Hydrogenedentota bacterium]